MTAAELSKLLRLRKGLSNKPYKEPPASDTIIRANISALWAKRAATCLRGKTKPYCSLPLDHKGQCCKE